MDLVDPYNRHFNMQDPPLNMEDDDENLLQGSRKRKRNQHKKVVCVPITGDPSKDKGQTPPNDFWAWRKYGQKPIKGSPYPRGYYRCSSSKGCSARKQVERSRKDPSMLIVTYTAEHNHAMGKLSASSKDVHDKERIKEDITQNDDDISNLLQENNYKGSLIHSKNEIDMMEKYSDNASHFSCIIDSPSSSEYNPFEEEEKQVVDACAWICMEEGGQYFQYVEDWKGGDAGKEDVCLATTSRSEGDDVFSELGMLPELASIFNKRDINDNIEERRGPDEIRSITLDHDLSIFGPLHSASLA